MDLDQSLPLAVWLQIEALNLSEQQFLHPSNEISNIYHAYVFVRNATRM